jgi:hypothetical protein
MSVRSSVRMEYLGSHWPDFHEILYLRIFRKSLEKIKVFFFNRIEIEGTLREDEYTRTFLSYRSQFFLE